LGDNIKTDPSDVDSGICDTQ